ERFVQRVSNRGPLVSAQTLRYLRCCQPDSLRQNLLLCFRGNTEVRDPAIQTAIERLQHEYAKQGNRDQPGRAGYRIVECRGNRGEQRSDDQWRLRTISSNKPASPPRQQEHDQYKRNQGSPGARGAVSLHLNQIERQKKQRSTQRRVEQQRQHIRSAEGPRTEK